MKKTLLFAALISGLISCNNSQPATQTPKADSLVDVSGMDLNDGNKEVTTASFAKLINSRPVVLVDFSATWCKPCQHLAPKIEQLKSELPGKFALLKSDVDRDAHLADSMNIAAMPTLLIYKNGELKWRTEGDLEKQDLFDALMKVQ